MPSFPFGACLSKNLTGRQKPPVTCQVAPAPSTDPRCANSALPCVGPCRIFLLVQKIRHGSTHDFRRRESFSSGKIPQRLCLRCGATKDCHLSLRALAVRPPGTRGFSANLGKGLRSCDAPGAKISVRTITLAEPRKMSFIALRVSLELLIERLVATGFVFRPTLGRAGERARIVAMELCATNDASAV